MPERPSPYTDARWDPSAGGLPEHNALLGVLNCRCAGCIRERGSHLRSDTCAAGAPGIAEAASPSWPSTITVPVRPGLTAEQADAIALELERLVAMLRGERQ